MSTTIVAPVSHGQTGSIVGYSYVLAAEQIRQEITEQLDVVAQGLVVLVGDLEGSGSDTLRITRFGGLGFADPMTALSGETDAIVPTGLTLGTDSVTLGRYGLAKEQTYTDQILARAEMIGLADMVAMVPASLLSTMRANAATIGATFATGAGTSGQAWSYDHELELIALFHETEGYEQAVRRSGKAISMRHPEQFTDLRNSIRSEPGLQGSADLQQALLGLSQQEGGGFDFLGLRNFSSFDVPQSAGDWIGSAFMPGAIAWVRASTRPIQTENPAKTVFVPEYGIIIEYKSTGEIATARFAANAFFGMAKLDPSLFPQFKITSIND
jgi:hypothetical protein